MPRLALALLLALVAVLVPSAVAPAAEVTLTDTGFEPSTVTVDTGEAVHFTSTAGSPWELTSDGGLVDSGPLTAKAGFTVGLSVPGTHTYRSGTRTGTVVVRALKLPGAPTDDAEEQIPDAAFPPVDPQDVGMNWQLGGTRMSKSRIMVGLREGATVQQVNDALDAANVRIIGGAPTMGMLLVQTRPTGWGSSFDTLDAAVDRLRAAKGIAYAARSTEVESLVAPRRTDGAATGDDGKGFDWGDPFTTHTWALTSSTFPEAWNATEQIKRKRSSVVTGIIDKGFAPHADLPGLQIQSQLCPTGGACRDLDNAASLHGNHVAGIIGAAHDDQGAEPGTSRGVDGANPLAKMYGYSTAGFNDSTTGEVDGATLVDKNLELFDLVLRSRPAELRVINYSMGAASFDAEGWASAHGNDRCGPGMRDDDLPMHADVVKAPCTPDNLDAWQQEMAALGQAALPIARAAAQQGVMIVQAAGNDGQKFQDGGTFLKIHTASRNEFSWVSAHWDEQGGGLPNPILTVQATEPDDAPRFDATFGADVAAPGDGILSTDDDGDYEVLGGSSMAAPQVTGLIGLMLADDPAMSLASIRRRVLDWATPGTGTGTPADFTWSMPDRTNRDDNADGMVDYRTTNDQVRPAELNVDLDACGSEPAPGKHAGTYTWKVGGTEIATTPDCRYRWKPKAEGTYSVTLTVTGVDGVAGTVTKPVKVEDLLIISVGDSIASGEGNPDLLDPDPRWQEARCHRSAFGGPAQAARILEQSDTRSSVTLLHLACSGARMTADLDEQGRPKPGPLGVGGLLTAYEGVVPDDEACENSGRLDNIACEPPQLQRAKDFAGDRVPDALFVSIGANDMRFSTILMHCMAPLNACHQDEGGRGLFLERIALLKNRYADVAAKIKALFPTMPSDRVFITQYPDPTTTDDGSVTLDCGFASGITDEEAMWAHTTVLPALNRAVADAAQAHGWTLADGVPEAFENHGYCAEDDWLVTVFESVWDQDDENGGFHPNYEGHAAYAKELVRSVKATLGLSNAGGAPRPHTDRAPRISAFRSLLAGGPATVSADVNDRSKDGNRRIARTMDEDGNVTEKPDTSSSADPQEKTAPDGRVDMRDLRRYRDAWLDLCRAGGEGCPAAGDIKLDGAADHPKRDLNHDGCVVTGDAGCGAAEKLFARADLNGDHLVVPDKKAIVPWKADGTPAADRTQATRMTDLDVLRAAWTGGAGAEGYAKDDLGDLLRSADVEVQADAVLDTGASKATLQLQTTDGLLAGPQRTIRRADGSVVMTIPVSSPSTQYELVTVAGTGRGTSRSTSAPFSLKYGEDKLVAACPAVSIAAAPQKVPADGASTSVITATLHRCAGRKEVAGKKATFTLHGGTSGAKLTPLAATTDAQGEVRAEFTAGTTLGTFDVDVAIEPGGGEEPLAATVEMETIRKLQIRYVWKQVIDEWSESGTTVWNPIDPLRPDCRNSGVEYCINSWNVGLKPGTSNGIQRAGTLTGGGNRFDLTEEVTNSAASSQATWNVTKHGDGKTEDGGRTSTWWVTDPKAYKNTLVAGLNATQDDAKLRLSGLQNVGDLPYHYALTGARTGGTFDPIEGHDAINTYLLVPQPQKILFGAHPDKQIEFAKDGETFKPFSSCGTLEQDLTSERGYYVPGGASDYMAGAMGIGRKPDYAPGDRPMPTGPGTLKVKYAFAAVASYSGDPSAPAPVLPDCLEQNPPSAAFTFAPSGGDAVAKEGRSVRFEDGSTDPENDISTYEWDFGDGTTGTGAAPHHLYEDDGEFEVTLKVTDARGQHDSATHTVVVENEAPEVEIFDLDAQRDKVGLKYTLVDPGHVDKQQLRWKLTSSNPRFPANEGTAHAGIYTRGPYTNLPAGTYPLRMTVTDKDGASASDDAVLVIKDEPVEDVVPPPKWYATCDPNVKLDAEERAFLDLVNDYRERNGLSPVAVSATLTRAARRHADDMAAKDYMAHDGKDGSTFASRAWDAGYPRSFGVGENLIETGIASEMLAGWRASSTGHNENMLRPEWRAIGIARAKGSSLWRTATTYGSGLDCPATDASRVPSTPGSRAALKGEDVAPSGDVTRRVASPEVAVETPAREDERPLALLAAAPGPDAEAPQVDHGPTLALAWEQGAPRAGVEQTLVNRSRTVGGTAVPLTADFGDGTAPLALAAGASGTHAYPGDEQPNVFTLGLTGGGRTAETTMLVHGLMKPWLSISGSGNPVTGRPYEISATAYDRSTWHTIPGLELTFAIGDREVKATTNADGIATAKLALGETGGMQTITVRFPGSSEWGAIEDDYDVDVYYNHPPVADAGGPYLVGEGTDLLLNGMRSKNEDSTYVDWIERWEWDLDGDGAYDDREGRLPAKVTPEQLEELVCHGPCAPGTAYPIGLRVTDHLGASGTTTTTVKVTPDFDLTLGNESMVVVPGKTNSFAVTVIGSKSHAKPVTLSVEDLPAGVSAEFSQNPVTPSGASVLKLTGGADLEQGTFPIKVKGDDGTTVKRVSNEIEVAFGLIPICHGIATGIVTDEVTGEPLAGVGVSTAGAADETDANGRYYLEKVDLGFENAPARQTVSVRPSGHWSASKQGLMTCGGVTELDFELLAVQQGKVAGTIVDEQTRKPIDGVTVTDPVYRSTVGRTGADGRYAGDVDLGTRNADRAVTLSLEHADYWPSSVGVQAKAGTTATGDGEMLRKCTGTLVGGTVVDADTGTPVGGGSVSVFTRDNSWSDLDVPVDAQGRFTVDAQAPLAWNNTRRVVKAVPNPGPAAPPGSTGQAGGFVLEQCGDKASTVLKIKQPKAITGTVAGTVRDEDTGQPVAGVAVRVCASGDCRNHTTTADGTYAFTGVSGGFEGDPRDATVTATLAEHHGDGRTVRVQDGATTTADLKVLKVKYGAATVRVVDAVTKAPIPGAEVNDYPLYCRTLCFTVDREGKATREGLGLGDRNAARDYAMTAKAPGYWSQTKGLMLRAGEHPVVEYELQQECKPARITGTVVNAQGGAPIAGASIERDDSSGRWTTNEQGRFVIDEIKPASGNNPRRIRLTASADGFFRQSKDVTIYCGAQITIDFGSQTSKTGTISGTVTGPGGTPLADAFVGTEFGETARTSASGTYRITGVPLAPGNAPRAWKVNVRPEGFKAAEKTVTAVADTDVPLDFAFAADNVPPTAPSKTVTLDEDTTADVSVAGADPDGDELSYHVIRWPQHGKLTGAYPDLRYAPDADWNGSDRLEYVVNDGAASSETAVVTFAVAPVADAPRPKKDRYEGVPDQTFRIPVAELLANDQEVDGEALTFAGAELLDADAKLARDGDTLVFTPPPGFKDVDDDVAFLRYEVTDGTTKADALVEFRIAPKPAAPDCADEAFDVEPGVALGHYVACEDVNEDTITYRTLTQPAHGALVLRSYGSFVYTPVAGFTGTDTWTYEATDATGKTTGPVTVTMRVGIANAAPVCTDVAASGPEDEAVTFALDCADADPLTFDLAAPAHGKLDALGAGRYRYTPAADWHGAETLAYTASDDRGLTSAAAAVKLTVTPVNDLPVCRDVVGESRDGAAVSVAPGCADVDGDALTVAVSAAGSLGATTVVDGRLRYVPTAGARGVDVMRYVARDAAGASEAAKLTVTVTPAKVEEEPKEDEPKPPVEQPRPPVEQPKPQPPVVPAPIAPLTPAPVVEGSAALLSCADRPVVLEDVIPVGRRVKLLGLVGPEHAGRKVEIRLEGSSRVVAAPVVDRTGRFSASAPVPTGYANRDEVRYTAKLGSDSSRALRLWRRLQVEDVRAKGDKVVIAGRVTGPLARRAADRVIEVRRQAAGCKTGGVLAKVTPDAKGRFRVEVPRGEGEKGAVYRLKTTVRNATAKTKKETTFSLPRVIDF